MDDTEEWAFAGPRARTAPTVPQTHHGAAPLPQPVSRLFGVGLVLLHSGHRLLSDVRIGGRAWSPTSCAGHARVSAQWAAIQPHRQRRLECGLRRGPVPSRRAAAPAPSVLSELRGRVARSQPANASLLAQISQEVEHRTRRPSPWPDSSPPAWSPTHRSVRLTRTAVCARLPPPRGSGSAGRAGNAAQLHGKWQRRVLRPRRCASS